MEYKNIPDLKIENAELVFKPNFSGEVTEYNRLGYPQFNVRVPDALVESLKADGWNVQAWPKEPDEDRDQIWHILVTVRYDGYNPPSVFLVAPNGKKTAIDTKEAFTKKMPGTKFSNIDLIIHPYQWEVNGKSGVKAYLQTGYFVIDPDPFADKYAEEEAPVEVPF